MQRGASRYAEIGGYNVADVTCCLMSEILIFSLYLQHLSLGMWLSSSVFI